MCNLEPVNLWVRGRFPIAGYIVSYKRMNFPLLTRPQEVVKIARNRLSATVFAKFSLNLDGGARRVAVFILILGFIF